MNAQSDLLPEKNVIAGMTDEGMLNAYHSAAYDMSDDIVARIEMFRLAGTASEDWLERTGGLVAYAIMTMRRAERRLIDLGFEPPVTRDGKERDIIRELRGRVKALEKLLAEARCSETKE